ncbi:hypothetical protein H0176_22305 [Methylorubrum populi]|uniref:KAP family P-loop NTPase fold protein n=1 Tax=Methylorubrum rhodesianum TaxID=29427 RepID=UPI00190D5FB0|nr:P-loop NTPase fold protein [Methylorubrum rhodesianum]MBK3404193.1 hypothetical protein [Methylorubrum rhodesianum]MBY0142983.1 hypothetical protein [Methylorubrum populi]
MWSDVETDQDFLNFRVMANLAGQMILDAGGKPLSIGISGGWGVGKSSMVKLIASDLEARSSKKLVFLTFNAWLYQGHDDAKAALMEEIARTLLKYADGNKDVIGRIKELGGRIDFFRVARYGAEAAATYASGGVPFGAITKSLEGLWDHFTDGDITKEDIGEAKDFAKEHKDDAKGLIKPKKAPETPPQAIHAFREHFRKVLEELDVTLVVFVDDLDRCLPSTVIGTLEAMRLFLFMDRTAFVIAADDKMIKEAVRIHFKEARLDDDLVVSYFDKLIQVPLRVPPLGINEVRAYLLLLFAENAGLDADLKQRVKAAVNDRLAASWKGLSVDAAFIAGQIEGCPTALQSEFALADRLAKQMATSRKIAGNPRLIKRFLNTLSIRRKLAAAQSIPVDGAVLAKILLFERCAAPASFEFLVQSVTQAVDGKSESLRTAERVVRGGGELPEDKDAWSADRTFVTEWLKLDPPLAEADLRGAIHVGRESLPIISADDRVSKEAQDILAEAVSLRLKPTADLRARFVRLIPDEKTFVVGKLLERGASEAEWGTPDILWGLAMAAEADPDAAKRLVVFLSNLDSAALRPPIVPRIRDTAWGGEVMAEWRGRSDMSEQMKRVLAPRKARA